MIRVACILGLTLSLFGVLITRGPLASGVRVESLSRDAQRGIAGVATYGALHRHDYTTTPSEPTIALGPDDRVRVLTVPQMRAVMQAGLDDERTYWLARTGWCESHFDAAAVGAAGEEGAWQVLARYHGTVPATLDAQATQAARIVTEHGTWPWSTRDGCPSWNR